MNISRITSVVLFSSILSACGGSGGSTEIPSTPLTFTQSIPQQLNESTEYHFVLNGAPSSFSVNGTSLLTAEINGNGLTLRTNDVKSITGQYAFTVEINGRNTSYAGAVINNSREQKLIDIDDAHQAGVDLLTNGEFLHVAVRYIEQQYFLGNLAGGEFNALQINALNQMNVAFQAWNNTLAVLTQNKGDEEQVDDVIEVHIENQTILLNELNQILKPLINDSGLPDVRISLDASLPLTLYYENNNFGQSVGANWQFGDDFAVLEHILPEFGNQCVPNTQLTTQYFF
jgi:hypothetical protein